MELFEQMPQPPDPDITIYDINPRRVRYVRIGWMLVEMTLWDRMSWDQLAMKPGIYAEWDDYVVSLVRVDAAS